MTVFTNFVSCLLRKQSWDDVGRQRKKDTKVKGNKEVMGGFLMQLEIPLLGNMIYPPLSMVKHPGFIHSGWGWEEFLHSCLIFILEMNQNDLRDHE